MTILGKHTIAEVRSMITELEYEVAQVEKSYRAMQSEWHLPFAAPPASLTDRWNAAKAKIAKQIASSKTTLTLLSKGNPLVPDDVIPAEDEWNKIYPLSFGGGEWDKSSMKEVNLDIEKLRSEYKGTLVQTDRDTGRPQWSAGDADMSAIKNTTAVINAGEAAAKKAADAVKPFAIGAGVLALVGAGIAGVVLVKTYMPAPRRG